MAVDQAHAAFLESLRATRIGGRYVVDRVLGRGGMGLVIAAHYPELDQHVAVKLLLPEYAANATLSARFMREAKLAAMVESPHLVRVFDVGRVEPGVPYMVMELLSGQDLGDALRVDGPMEIQDAVDVLLQAIAGVAHLHANGIVHRDLKPSNIFLVKVRGGARTVKILDFGISKHVKGRGSSGGALTRTESVLGTPRYMSPEQVKESKTVDTRSDIWSLGVILYEVLTGETPFVSENEGVGEIFGMILYTDPVPASTHRADLPPELEATIMRCLRREKAERFANVGELAAALEPFAGDLSRHRVSEIKRALTSIRPPLPAPAADDDAPGMHSAQTLEEPDSEAKVAPTMQAPAQPARAATPALIDAEKPRVPGRASVSWKNVAMVTVGIALVGGAVVYLATSGDAAREVTPAASVAAVTSRAQAPASAAAATTDREHANELAIPPPPGASAFPVPSARPIAPLVRVAASYTPPPRATASVPPKASAAPTATTTTLVKDRGI